MLPICIHKDDGLAFGGSCAGLDGRAITHGVVMAQNLYLFIGADFRCVVGRTVIDDDDLSVVHDLPESREKSA